MNQAWNKWAIRRGLFNWRAATHSCLTCQTRRCRAMSARQALSSTTQLEDTTHWQPVNPSRIHFYYWNPKADLSKKIKISSLCLMCGCGDQTELAPSELIRFSLNLEPRDYLRSLNQPSTALCSLLAENNAPTNQKSNK